MDVNNFNFGPSVVVVIVVVVLIVFVIFVVVVGGGAEDVCKGTSYKCDVWMSGKTR